MELQRYKEILDALDMFIEVGTNISNRLVGTRPKLHHHGYADTIFTKLLCHAITLRKLSPQVDFQIEYELWDMPSACAIARCLIEAHDVLEYIALANISEEEITFRTLIWMLHDKQRRSKMFQAIKSTAPECHEIQQQEMHLQKEAEQHPQFQKLNLQQRNKILNGDAPSFLLSQKDLNSSNGINHEYHVAATMMLSQHVHSFPMAVHQLQHFRAGSPDSLNLSALPIQLSLPFLARSIARMADIFLHADFEINEQQSKVFDFWLSIAKNGTDLASATGTLP